MKTLAHQAILRRRIGGYLATGLLVAALASCGDEAQEQTAGTSIDASGDAAIADLGVQDTSEADAAGTDASGADSSNPDAVSPDTASPDAASPDAASPDAADPDAAGTDAGAGTDAISPDPDSTDADSAGPDSADPDATDADPDAAATDTDTAGGDPDAASTDLDTTGPDPDATGADTAADGTDSDTAATDGDTGPALGTLCNPCTADSECGADSACVQYSPEMGSFCAPACGAGDTCPTGYACQEFAGTAAAKAKRCVMAPAKPGDSAPAVCACSEAAIAGGMSTNCSASNEAGTCTGKRGCSAQGLGPCSAAAPAADLCDGIDNDCDGQTDEQTCTDGNPCTTDACDPASGGCVNSPAAGACDDGNGCTEKDQCKNGACVGGLEKSCNDNNPCTSDACDPANGCANTAAADGASCDGDGNDCTPGDKCMAGLCEIGAPLDCSDNDPCTANACDKATGKCVSSVFADGTECQDGSVCTTGDTCKTGKCVGAAIACDDNNPCTADACDAANGCTATAADGELCEDGDLCTAGDSCAGGKCKGGNAKVCNSTDPCASASCNPLDGTCATSPKPMGASCDDDSACTAGDICSDKGCSGTPVDCDDKNPCTIDACDGDLGCLHKNTAAPCSDGNACTDFDECVNGTCTGLAKDATVSCDDSNPCTTDSCDPTNGCEHDANTAPCEDGSACTSGDTCAAGKCQPGSNACLCQVDGDCKGLEDGNLCNGTLFCDTAKVPFTCKVKTATVVVCPPSSAACLGNACDPATGKCGAKPIDEGKPCDADANVCTASDACKAGKCTAGALLSCDDKNPCTKDACDAKLGCVYTTNNGAPCEDGNGCTQADICSNKICTPGKIKLCSDSNPCTSDACDPKTGSCVFSPSQGSCSDGNPCTIGDTCVAGKCGAGGPANCNDNNPCTNDSCDTNSGLCVALPNAATCSDGNLCTTGDSCSGGLCKAGIALQCDDKNPCTTDSCSPKTGQCLFAANTLPCNDGSACTVGDLCKAGVCGGTAKNCEDGNLCTTDGCDAKTGACAYANNTAACEDGNSCSKGDICKDGACQAGVQACPCTALNASTVCNDNNPCTADACLTGVCVHKVSAGIACEDGNLCTAGGVCSAAGACVPKTVGCDDKNPCTVDSCDKATGKCTFTAISGGCDDGNLCSVGDGCVAGKCVGQVKNCDDGNACTADSCSPVTGACTSVNLTSACNDGNACTTGDVCSGGKCTPTGKKSCDDANVCTADLCNPTTGLCTSLPASGSCSDGNACTSGDACVLGKCVGAASISCDDGNPCTNDACDKATGKCLYVNNTLPCDDKSLCTNGDICAAGKCAGVTAVTCNDNNSCTTDACVAATGKCSFTNNTLACNDGKACTAKDICTAGVCVGVAVVCNDSNPCTTDSCNALTGACTYVNNTATCDDNSLCTQGESCLLGKCTPKTVTNCNDNNPCTDDLCSPTTGKCLFQPNTASCNDGLLCTTGDKCGAGKCLGTATAGCCTSSTNCNTTANACIVGTCSAIVGGKGTCTFVNAADGKVCIDGNACTSGDKCAGGSCGGAAVDCNDNNLCTTDACQPSVGCFITNNTLACNDNNACTSGDICAAGKCLALTTVNCDDKNVCTADSCDTLTGKCSNAPIAGKCEDGNLCTTGDSCAAGTCTAGLVVNCDDKNACTVDACSTATGLCAYKLLSGTACSDGNLCTTVDGCAAGKCVGTTAPNCNDGNVCTNDSCDPLKGCVGTANAAPCDDGDKCTLLDVCALGLCKAGAAKSCADGNVCTDDACAPLTGTCSWSSNTAACNDKNACTLNDVCAAGKCAGAAKSCDDANPCTADSCNTLTGLCVNAPLLTGACEDGNLCTLTDLCIAGKCSPGTKKVCNDNNVCTTDSCDVASGACAFAPASGAVCSDGNNCTTGDTCAAGKCTPKVTVPCNDGNACTTDACDTAGKCMYVNNTLPCEDANKCLSGDKCLAGKCVSGTTAVVCNDGCSCTLDSCNPTTGCVKTFNAAASCLSGGKLIKCDAATYQNACTGCAIPQ